MCYFGPNDINVVKYNICLQTVAEQKRGNVLL